MFASTLLNVNLGDCESSPSAARQVRANWRLSRKFMAALARLIIRKAAQLLKVGLNMARA